MTDDREELLPCPFCGSVPTNRNNIMGTDGVRCITLNCPISSIWISVERWNTRSTPPSPTDAMVDALAKIMPLRIHDGPEYAEVYFSDGSKHSTQAMTMNPQDWRAIQEAYDRACLTAALSIGGDARAMVLEEAATEQEADAAIVILKRAIEAAENSNQAGENAVVRAAKAINREFLR